jgi:hypothetical protein
MTGRAAPMASPTLDELGAPALDVRDALVAEDFDAVERLVANRASAIDAAQEIAAAGALSPVLAAWLREARAAAEAAEVALRARLDEIRDELAALAAGRAALRAYTAGSATLSPGFVDLRD